MWTQSKKSTKTIYINIYGVIYRIFRLYSFVSVKKKKEKKYQSRIFKYYSNLGW